MFESCKGEGFGGIVGEVEGVVGGVVLVFLVFLCCDGVFDFVGCFELFDCVLLSCDFV